MGSSLSNLTEGGVNGGALASGPGLGDIPEACVARVFVYLSPIEICNLARLNRAFRGAASSDGVWESKLPVNYHKLLELLSPEIYDGFSKKDIFALFARSVSFDDGNKQVWVDKVTGKVCFSISARAMDITGIEDRRYWTWIPTEESRFQEVAYLQQIWWFEVDGAVKLPLLTDVYTLSFRLHLGKFSCNRLGRRVTNFENTHGWDIKPVRFEFTTSDGQHATFECCLDDTEPEEMKDSLKRGCWIDYDVGEFMVTDSESDTEIKFSMKQIDCTHSKGGICVDSVSIIPTNLKRRRRKMVTN